MGIKVVEGVTIDDHVVYVASDSNQYIEMTAHLSKTDYKNSGSFDVSTDEGLEGLKRRISGIQSYALIGLEGRSGITLYISEDLDVIAQRNRQNLEHLFSIYYPENSVLKKD